jgi:hypothetical protein
MNLLGRVSIFCPRPEHTLTPSDTGGFYVTPDEENAQLFGTTFLANTCMDKGGVVIIGSSLIHFSSGLGVNLGLRSEFSFDTSQLKYVE